jgi:epoxyqueuosine reductase
MSTPVSDSLNNLIINKAVELGFASCGISKAEPLNEDGEKLKKWLDHGHHAGMDYMQRNLEKRTDPGKLFDNVKSVISVLLNYYPGVKIPETDNFKFAKYAYGSDYHFLMKSKIKQLMAFIREQKPGTSARAFVDSAPLLDRACARKAGLGWIGKNTCLITPEQGSFFFIGEILTDLPLDYEVKTVHDHCGGCTRCIKACPTGALKPYELDSRKCISYWTIENKTGQIPEKFRGSFKDWIFGCDICQDVCPWNKLSRPHHEPAFNPSEGLLSFLKKEWQQLTEDQFREIFKNSSVKRAKFSGLKRNINFSYTIEQHSCDI